MENKEEVFEKLNKIIDEKNGIKVSGQGMIANNTEKMIEKLDKIQKFLYFMEKRQNEIFEWIKSQRGEYKK